MMWLRNKYPVGIKVQCSKLGKTVIISFVIGSIEYYDFGQSFYEDTYKDSLRILLFPYIYENWVVSYKFSKEFCFRKVTSKHIYLNRRLYGV